MACQHCLTELINCAVSKSNFSFYLMVAAPLCNFVWLCDPCGDPYQLISAMATVDKKKEDDAEGRHFEGRRKLQYFFSENRNNCVCLICKATVAVCKEFNVKRQNKLMHTTSRQREITLKKWNSLKLSWPHNSRSSCRPVSQMKIPKHATERPCSAKHDKPFTRVSSSKTVRKMEENVCPGKKEGRSLSLKIKLLLNSAFVYQVYC